LSVEIDYFSKMIYIDKLKLDNKSNICKRGFFCLWEKGVSLKLLILYFKSFYLEIHHLRYLYKIILKNKV
jgi:hypothetical protein